MYLETSLVGIKPPEVSLGNYATNHADYFAHPEKYALDPFRIFGNLYYVGDRILGGTMTLGEMSQFSAYVGIIYGPLRWMANIPRTLARTMTSIVKIYDVIDEEEDVSDRQNAVDMEIEGNISFEEVSFGYDNCRSLFIPNAECFAQVM